MLNDDRFAPDHPINKIDPRLLAKQDPAYFGAKLDFKTRCAILALHMQGIPRTVLAAAYNVDRRTVGHIVNHTSPHYRMVRKEVERLGEVEFLKVYTRDTDIALVNQHRHDQEVTQTQAKYDEERPTKRAEKVERPNRRASRCQGIHVIHTFDGDQRFDLDWHDFEDPEIGACWAYRNLDGDGEWYRFEGKGAYTSHQTLALLIAEYQYKQD